MRESERETRRDEQLVKNEKEINELISNSGANRENISYEKNPKIDVFILSFAVPSRSVIILDEHNVVYYHVFYFKLWISYS